MFLSVFAALPTTGLKIQYDMVTISGSTLIDVSGNGNDGTLHSTTSTARGLTFNGTSSYIDVPAIVKNSDYTVIAVHNGSNVTSVVWYEGDAGQNSFMRLSSNSSNYARLSSSGGDSGSFGPIVPNYASDYHGYYVQRSSRSAMAGMIDRPYRSAVTLTGTPNYGGDICGSLGAQSFNAACATQNSFFTGSMAYFLLYTRALTVNEINAAYEAIRAAISGRSVFMGDITAPVVSGAVWTRMGAVINATNSGQEPSVIYDTADCQLVASPCFKMLFSRASTIHYAESLGGLDWTEQAGSVISKTRPAFLKVGSTYYAYVEQTSSTNAQPAFDLYTSANGINWTLAQASVISKGSAGAWDDGTINNPFVIHEGSTWYMAYEAIGTGTGSATQIGVATSTDGLAWTKSPANPITGYYIGTGGTPQGPFLYHAADGWYLWAGIKDGASSSVGRFQTTTFNSLWVPSTGSNTFGHTGLGDETGAGDPCLVEANGKTYLFVGVTPAAGNGTIKLAIADMPLSQLVKTAEGAITSAP